MANVNSPFGLRPVRHRTGAAIVQNGYTIASGYTEDIFRGDVVELTGTSRNIAYAAADNEDNIGVFAGCEWTPTTGGKRVYSPYWPDDQTGTNIVAFVWDDPWIIFEAQYDTVAGQTPAVTDLGNGIKWARGTGSTTTGISGLFLDHTNKGTTDTQLRLEALVPRDDNTMGDFANFEVTFMEHALMNVVAGVGGV